MFSARRYIERARMFVDSRAMRAYIMGETGFSLVTVGWVFLLVLLDFVENGLGQVDVQRVCNA